MSAAATAASSAVRAAWHRDLDDASPSSEADAAKIDTFLEDRLSSTLPDAADAEGVTELGDDESMTMCAPLNSGGVWTEEDSSRQTLPASAWHRNSCDASPSSEPDMAKINAFLEGRLLSTPPETADAEVVTKLCDDGSTKICAPFNSGGVWTKEDSSRQTLIPASSSPAWHRSDESKKRKQRGYTSAGDVLRTCVCRDSERCRRIMWEWSQLGKDYRHMVAYGFMPKRSKKNTTLAKHLNGYREGCLNRLLGDDGSAAEQKVLLSSRKDRIPVALHHWKRCLRDAVNRSKEIRSNMDKFRCSIDDGTKAGLTEDDECVVKGTDGMESFYLFPTVVDYEVIESELEEAREKHRVKVEAHERMLRDMVENPEKYAMQIERLREQLAESQRRYEEVKADRERDMLEYERSLKEMKDEFEMRVR